jgi:predicted transcriptional regulator
MSEITIPVNDELMDAMRKSAEQSQQSVEEVARRGLATYFARETEFQRVTEYLLHKNAELYRRLAQ